MSEHPSPAGQKDSRPKKGSDKAVKKSQKKAAAAAAEKHAPPPEDLVMASAAQAPEVVTEPATAAAEAAAFHPAHGAEGAAAALAPLISPDQREMLEKLSLNLARAAMTAQGAIAEAALRQADRPAALTPDPFHVAPALTQVMGQLAAQPDRLVRAQADLYTRYMDLWASVSRRMMGGEAEPVAHPPKGDKRFTDPEWSENPVFDAIKQSYLVTSDWLNSLVAEVEGVDPIEKRRVEFFMKMLTDAFSPSNFLLSNPVALREAVATHGASLVKGMENFAADLSRGGGQLAIAQTDLEMFRIGENVATAPGKIVFQTELFQLIQYEPTTEAVCEVPLLIFPPWINKFYILDLRPENSMIRWLTDQGITVFVVSWVNPDSRLAEKTFENYMFEGIYTAVEAVCHQADVEKVNTVGYCIGGTLLSCALAHMAAVDYRKVNTATFFAAQQDFSEAGDLLIFTNEGWLKDLERKMDEGGGVLSGQTMADTFNALRANDLIWSFFVNNYLLGKEPRPFDLLFWNSDQTRMPKALHLFYLKRFYGENALAKGELELGGVRLDLGKVRTPIYVQSSKEDHIAPARSVFKGAKLFGGPVTFTLAGSGHIAGVVNAPVARKYQHWTLDHLPETLEHWQGASVEAPGSWWPHWAEWLSSHSGGQVPARDPSNGKFTPIEDAPGSYVKVKS